MDLDALLVKKVAEVNKSFIGRPLSSLASRIGGVSVLACLNIVCTAALGFVITYSLYTVGGILPALPPTLLTAAVLLVLVASVIRRRLGLPAGPTLRKLLVLAILLSLPFSIFSLPLLHSMSGPKRAQRKR